MRKVVVTGIGIVSPVGIGATAFQNLLKKQCGIVQLGDDFKDLPSTVGGKVRDFDVTQHISPQALKRMPIFAQYAMAATKMALDDAQWHPTDESDLKASGVAIGSGIGGMEAAYDNAAAYSSGGYRKVSPLYVPSLLANMAAGQVSIATGFRGPNHAVSTACTAGAHAIGDASQFIRSGMADVMVAGATEAAIHPLAVSGFARARSLATAYNGDPQRASRPFDSKRDGFVIGEGSAVLVLEEEQHARDRGAQIYARVAGYGASGDAHHITAPHPDGRGARDCMEMALRSAGMAPSAVGYVNAHATSTKVGDAIEARAIASVFGTQGVAISSTKGATGHLLGAAGALESAFTVLALHHQTLPPGLNLEECDFEGDFVKEARKADVRAAMSNSFGFGGTNASILFERSE